MQVRVDDLAVIHRDGTRALDQLSLNIPAGQLCVVLGPSGAGKSTLLACIGGAIRPSSGKVHIDDVRMEPRNRRMLQRRIAMIHQQFGLVPRASVASNVMAGALTQMPWWRAMTGLYPRTWQARTIAALSAVELAPAHLPRRASALSGGQQQRVAIARAFVRAPSLLLADEPVASLDPGTAAAILTLIRRQAREHGTTVVCSLHQLELARHFADRLIAMQHGRIVYDGAPETFDKPIAQELYRGLLDKAYA